MANETLLLWVTVILSLAFAALALFAAKKAKRVKELNSDLVRVMREKDTAVDRYKDEVAKLQDQKELITGIGDKVDVVDKKVSELSVVPEKIDRLAEFWKTHATRGKKTKPSMTFNKVIDELASCKKSVKIATPVFPSNTKLIKTVLQLRRTLPVKIITQVNGSALNTLHKDGVEVAIADGADMSALILDGKKIISSEASLGKEMVLDPEFEVVTKKDSVSKTSHAFDSLWDMAEKL